MWAALMARGIQAGQDFQSHQPELFERKSSRDDTMQMLGECRKMLLGVREAIFRGRKILSQALLGKRSEITIKNTAKK